MQKFCDVVGGVRIFVMSRMMLIGKWLVFGGRMSSNTLHWMTMSASPFVPNTLSGREKLCVPQCSRVGMPLGRSIMRSHLANISMRWFDCSIAAFVKSLLASLTLSQSGWWQLKLLHHNIWLLLPSSLSICCSMYRSRDICDLLLVQSL